jgi:hypothetical protein
VFVGAYSPVSLGDYLAGSNHVLPTGGQPRYAAGLSAATFLRPQQVIVYDREALRAATTSSRWRSPRRCRRTAKPSPRASRPGGDDACTARSAVTPIRA